MKHPPRPFYPIWEEFARVFSGLWCGATQADRACTVPRSQLLRLPYPVIFYPCWAYRMQGLLLRISDQPHETSLAEQGVAHLPHCIAQRGRSKYGALRTYFVFLSALRIPASGRQDRNPHHQGHFTVSHLNSKEVRKVCGWLGLGWSCSHLLVCLGTPHVISHFGV